MTRQYDSQVAGLFVAYSQLVLSAALSSRDTHVLLKPCAIQVTRTCIIHHTSMCVLYRFVTCIQIIEVASIWHLRAATLLSIQTCKSASNSVLQRYPLCSFEDTLQAGVAGKN